MADTEKLTALKKAYAEIILNTAKEAAARVMAAERRAFRFQRELADAKEDALHMMVRLKHMMDSRIYEADLVASSQRSKIEELEAQLQEAEDIVKDLREELSLVRDELDSRPMSERRANHVFVSHGREEEWEGVAPSVSCDIQVPNSQTGHGAAAELGNLSDQRFSASLRDDHFEILHVSDSDVARDVTAAKEPELNRSESHRRTHALNNEDLSISGGLDEKSQNVRGDSTVQENGEDGRKPVAPTPIAKLCVSDGKSNARTKKDKKSIAKMYLTMNQRARNLRFKKNSAPSSWKRRQSLAKKVLMSLKETNLVAFKTSPTSVIAHSEETFSAARESEAEKDLGQQCIPKWSSSTAELCSISGLKESIHSTPVNDKSKVDKASTGEENGSAESSVTCVDAQTAQVPSCTPVEYYNELASDEALRPKNDESPLLTFQRKRKKESMGSADESEDIEVVKMYSDQETVVKPANIESDSADFFGRSSQQSDDKEDTLKQFKRSLKKMNVDKQELKRATKRTDVEKPTDTKPMAIGIVPRASHDSRRLAQVARQLLSMSEKKWWD